MDDTMISCNGSYGVWHWQYYLLNTVKAKFHYASWFEARSKLVADRFEAKFHYSIWFEAGSKLVGDQLRTS